MKKTSFHLLAAALLLLLLAGACRRFASSGPQAEIAACPQWDKVFMRTSGWTGADVGASFFVLGPRVLWVFGDTWVGEVEANRHVRATLVNNSIAVHPYSPGEPGKAPSPEEVNFYWGPEEGGKPTAWLRPAPAEGGTEAPTWYWPTGGGVVFPGPYGTWRLALFLIQLEKGPGPESVWAFQCMGSAVAVIDNIGGEVAEWKVRILALPHRIESGGPAVPSGGEVDWGVAAVLKPSPSPDVPADEVYIYGVESGATSPRKLILARVKAPRFEDLAAWEFFAGDGQWSSSMSRAAIVVNEVASELSVEPVPDAKGTMHYVMVYSEPPLGARIFVRTAMQLEGPWSRPDPIYTVPDIEGSETLFAYAAKGHAGISEPQTLLVSYIVNTHDFTQLATDASIYRPRFIRVPLTALGIQ